jgi:hypothetical protein
MRAHHVDAPMPAAPRRHRKAPEGPIQMRLREQLRWGHHGGGTNVDPGPATAQSVYYRSIIENPLIAYTVGGICCGMGRGVVLVVRGSRATTANRLPQQQQQKILQHSPLHSTERTDGLVTKRVSHERGLGVTKRSVTKEVQVSRNGFATKRVRHETGLVAIKWSRVPLSVDQSGSHSQ